jgi:hypothetical protein
MKRPQNGSLSAEKSRSSSCGCARPIEVSALLADRLVRLAVHVGLAVLDQALGKLVELLKVVGGEVTAFFPVEA